MKKTGGPKSILHLDMDAFFPSVESLDDPSLKGKPVIVGGPRERGVVSSASYEARVFGVHSALPMATALRRCPQGVFLPVRMSRYQEISREVFEIFRRFTALVETLSIDEAFLDVSGSERLFGSPEEIARKIKKAVFSQIGITVSAGVAPTKFVAKIASDIRKPDGLTVVPEGGVEAFLYPLPIEKLWGVGETTQKKLSGLGVRTIGDLSRVPREVLEKRFGKHGAHLYLLSHGIDDREVKAGREIKSVGHEDTYPEDIVDPEALRRELLSLAIRVSRRLRDKGLEGRTVTLKVKYSDFVQVTRSRTLEKRTDDGAEIFRRACRLLEKTDAGRRPVRLLGISLSNLENPAGCRQPGLFEQAAESQKQKRLNRTLDRIHGRFGEGSVLPGTLLKK
jgi:DNA polymerase-4